MLYWDDLRLAGEGGGGELVARSIVACYGPCCGLPVQSLHCFVQHFSQGTICRVAMHVAVQRARLFHDIAKFGATAD